MALRLAEEVSDADEGADAGPSYRVDPLSEHSEPRDFKILQDMSESRAKAKFKELQSGATLAQKLPQFPSSRGCGDSMCIIPVLAIVCAVSVSAVMWSAMLDDKLQDAEDWPDLQKDDLIPTSWQLALSVLGVCVGLVPAYLTLVLVSCIPAFMAWAGILTIPVSVIILGGVLCMFGTLIQMLQTLGLVLIFGGLLLVGALVYICREKMPVTVALLTATSIVLKETPRLMLIPFIFSVLSTAWTVAAISIAVGIAIDMLEQQATNMEIGLAIAAGVSVFTIGLLLITLWCHTACCHAFGLWYINNGKSRSISLQKSLRCTMTSFGSLCFGALASIPVQLLESVLRQCIGDFLEYFNEWAYVQCAVRGCSFVRSARITHSVMFSANAQYVAADIMTDAVALVVASVSSTVGMSAGRFAAGFVEDGDAALELCETFGGLGGMFVGFMSASLLTSGAKTVLLLWAEDPEPLCEARPDLHSVFERRILSKVDGEAAAAQGAPETEEGARLRA